MGGACSVPVKQVYGVHVGTTDVMEKQTNHVFVKGSSEPVEKEEMVQRLTLTFRGEDGRTYTMTRYLAQGESDTLTPRLHGRLKLYPYLEPHTDADNRMEIDDFISAFTPGHPQGIWQDSDGRLMNNKGRPVCDDAKKPNFFADNLHIINVLAWVLSVGAVITIGVTTGPMAASSASSACIVTVLLIYLALLVTFLRSF